ncbi:glycosyltransferase family 39 protein [Candidatus Jorgensenbacteria bacterium]|nr:glycosyltransferase family 39 protein [Candidatus Jorgensenbacteria bacterium]
MRLKANRQDKIILVGLFLVSFLLRIAFWSRFPPGFTADEATMGYDAYSLLKTGKDQFGTSWPLAFRSFGDWRPPLYVYASMPFIALFGLTPLSVRLPSMIAGSLEVGLAYLLTKELFSKKAGIFSAVLLMLSPWSLLQTRFAQEANLSTLIIFSGVTSFILWFKRRARPYALCLAVFFSLSFYSYHNARLTTPLLLIAMFWIIFRKKEKYWRQWVTPIIIGAVLVSPLFLWIKQKPEALFRRASAQSVFSDPAIKIALWKDIVSMPPDYPIWLSRLQHNKPLYYGKAILGGYLSHFDPRFLFLSGDPHERFRTPLSGLLNWTMIIFIPIGSLMFIQREATHRFILFWLFTSPIVASLSTIVPNSQHAQDMMIPLHLIGGVGAARLFEWMTVLQKSLALSLFLVSCSLFLYGYAKIIPVQTKYLQAWHYYGDLFKKLSPFYGSKIVFLGGQYYINLAFYLREDPAVFQEEVRISRPDNLAEFDHVESFGSYEFRKTRDIPTELNPDTVYVRLNENGELLPDDIEVVDREFWPDGKREYVAFTLSNDSND